MPDLDMPVDLLPDGRVRLALDKTAITLRRPRIGELRTLHESLEQTNDTIRDILTALPEAPARPEGDDPEAREAYAAARAARRTAERKAMAEVDDLRAAWMQAVVAALGDRPLPSGPTADLPTWAASGEVAVALVNHWQSVPLARGGR